MSMVIGTRLFGRPGEIYSPVSLACNDSQITLNGSTLNGGDMYRSRISALIKLLINIFICALRIESRTL